MHHYKKDLGCRLPEILGEGPNILNKGFAECHSRQGVALGKDDWAYPMLATEGMPIVGEAEMFLFIKKNQILKFQ